MSSPPSLYNFTRPELKTFLADLGAPSYAGEQVFHWLYQKKAGTLEEMTDLPKELREQLARKTLIQPLKLHEKQSSSDGTVKYAWEIPPEGKGETVLVESVLIPMARDEEGNPGRHTACLSTQAGCRMKCSFCATGVPKFKRQLSPAEILGQILGMERDSGVKFSNVVIMGMGEPFDNYENTETAIRILHDEAGLGLGRKRITVSTSGLIDQLKRFTKDDWPASLAVSLHSADPEKRSSLMPINKSNPLDKLRKAMRDYTFVRRLPVTLEYILLKGVNDGPEDADLLADYCKGLLCKVNLIRYNPVPTLPYDSPGDEVAREFQKRLKGRGMKVFIRERKGVDIDAACGQLGFKDGKVPKAV